MQERKLLGYNHFSPEKKKKQRKNCSPTHSTNTTTQARSLDFHSCQVLTRLSNLPAFQWVWCQKRLSKEPGLSILPKNEKNDCAALVQCQLRSLGEHGIPQLSGSNKVLPNSQSWTGTVRTHRMPQSNKAKSQSWCQEVLMRCSYPSQPRRYQ